MGASSRGPPHPVIPSGGSFKSIATVPHLSRSNRYEHVADPKIGFRGTLQDVTAALPREEDPARRHPPHADHLEVAVEHDGQDGEAHSEGVDRAAPLEEQ